MDENISPTAYKISIITLVSICNRKGSLGRRSFKHKVEIHKKIF